MSGGYSHICTLRDASVVNVSNITLHVFCTGESYRLETRPDAARMSDIVDAPGK